MTLGDNLPAPLNSGKITAICQASQCDVDVHVLETVGSTNTWLIEGEFPTAVTLCAAEHQTVGRGRRGKTWHSPHSGITFSMRFDRHEPIADFNGLSLLAGAVLCDCLRAVGVVDARVKWPNDVLVNNAKLAGILIESHALASKAGTSIVVGIGINYKRGVEAGLIDQTSTDLFALCAENAIPERSLLIADIATRLVAVVSSDVRQAIVDLAARWSDYDALAQAEVVVSTTTEKVIGRAQGIDAGGGIRITTAEGMRVFTSADVSVRSC